jgi:hypothetical protein
MNVRWKTIFFIIGNAVALLSCDKGIAPSPSQAPPVVTGWMEGMIHCQHWPPADSLLDLRLVAFKVFPPGDIIAEVQTGRAVVYPPIGGSALPFYVDSIAYLFSLPVGTFQYVVVAQQYGPSILADWRAVGQFDLDSNYATVSPVTIVERDTARGIDINVDFSNPPPPPIPP